MAAAGDARPVMPGQSHPVFAENGAVLAQPRLVTDGDVKGGRYVSDVVDIYVGTGPAS
jgi:hypothetical protein